METVMKEVSAAGMNLEGMLSKGVQSKLSGDPSSSTPIPDSTAGSAGAQEAAGISSASGTAVAADSSSSGAHAEAAGFDLDALKLSIIAGIRETVQKAFDQAPQLSKEEQAQVLQDLSSDADSLARSLALLDDAGNEADPVPQLSVAQDAQKEGHDNTSQEDQKTNQKNRPSVEEVLKAVEQPMKNGYVRSVGKRGIEYTTKFYAEIIDRMQSRHESSTQAYAAMGFDVEALGAERAYQAAKHARQRQKEDRLRRTSPAQFNGTLTEAETPGFDELTDEESALLIIRQGSYICRRSQMLKKNELEIHGCRYVFSCDCQISNFQMIHDTLALQEQSGVKTLSTKDLCAIFGETASGYQSWKDREEKKARKKQEELKTYGPKFNAIIKEYGFVPGKRGFRTALFRIYGDELGLKKIAQLMRAMGLHASDDPKRVYHSKDESMLPNYNHEAEAAPNLVQQNFRIAPRLIILTDITYMYFMNDDGSMQRFYVCAYYDAFTKEPLGWSTGLTQEQSLVDRAYRMMMDLHGHEFSGRGTPDCYVVVHTDQGSVYTSSDFSQLLEPDRFDHSCSRRGNSRDNAAILCAHVNYRTHAPVAA